MKDRRHNTQGKYRLGKEKAATFKRLHGRENVADFLLVNVVNMTEEKNP